MSIVQWSHTGDWEIVKYVDPLCKFPTKLHTNDKQGFNLQFSQGGSFDKWRQWYSYFVLI